MEDRMIKWVCEEVDRHDNLPDTILEEFYDFIQKPWGVVRKVEIKKTTDEKIKYLLEELTRRTLSELLYVHNDQIVNGNRNGNELKLSLFEREPTNKISNNKIEVIGSNQELNELVMKKIIKGRQ